MPARAIFIEYQRSVRPPGTTENSIINHWRRLSAEDKTRWVEKYNEIQQLDADAVGPRTAAHNAWNAFNVAQAAVNINPSAANLIKFRTGATTAVRRWKDRVRICNELRNAWQTLLDIEQAYLPNWNQESRQNATDRITDWTNMVNYCEWWVAQFQGRFDNPPVPLNPAGQPRLPAQWVTKEKRESVRSAFGANVGLMNPGVGMWVARDKVSGGMGKGTVWVRVGGNNVITDRLFRKDVYMNEIQWNDPKQWTGDIRDPNTKCPNEIVCHDALDRVVNLRNVVGLRERRHPGLIFNRSRHYRMFQNYCPYGDLHSMIERHRKAQPAPVPIPEPFVCAIAEGLQKRLNGAAPDWESIIHRDVKPLNILLDVQDPHRYPRYPNPAVTDFGLAFRTTPGDPNNPSWYNTDAGTPGFLAPEQRRFFDANTLDPIDEIALSQKTNVYGIGLILYCMVTLNVDPPQPIWFGNGNLDTTLALPIAGPAATYDPTLRNLITRCLAFDPTARPTPQQILQTVAARIDERAGQPNRSNNMRSGTANAMVTQANGLFNAPYKYQIGMALPA